MKSKNQVNKDNPQGRLWWLAGIIDGEGNFGAAYSIPSPKLNPKRHVIRPYFQLGMCENETVSIIHELLKSYGIVSTKCQPTRAAVQKRLDYNARPLYTVRVCGMENILKMVDILGDKLITKKEVALLLGEYSKLRLERKGKSRNSPYRRSEINIVEKIRKLNHRGARWLKTLNDFTPRLPILEDVGG